ncbi:lactate dehydrogenase, partial [Acidithiobacillus ferrooxidans]|nr:lactate dehydrogenase [Acidithiobacillus ferrooxidans]
AADYGTKTNAAAAFVSTNSICQGSQVPILWPLIFGTGNQITFAHTSFKWANLANHNAGVTVVIVAIAKQNGKAKRLFSMSEDGATIEKQTDFINAYLVSGVDVIVSPISKSYDIRGLMEWGNKPTDGGNLLLSSDEREKLLRESPSADRFVKRFVGAQEFIQGEQRYCLWIEDEEREDAEAIPELKRRIEAVAKMRSDSKAAETRPAAAFPHRFRQIQSTAKVHTLVLGAISSENRDYLPCGLLPSNTIISNKCYAIYDAPLWNLALIASRLHWVWIGTVCVRLEMRFSYSNTLGWNTFPVPLLTEQNKADLTTCAENILLAREVHFPATIADLYDPNNMPENLRHAHERNDEVLERIYIGRRFKNDTERLERLFELYTKMTAAAAKAKPAAKATKGKAS